MNILCHILNIHNWRYSHIQQERSERVYMRTCARCGWHDWLRYDSTHTGDPDNPEWELTYTWKKFGYNLYFQGETVEYPSLDAMKAAIEEED